MSLFCVLNRLYYMPEMRFEFPFNLIGKLTMAFLTVQSWRVLKSWYTGTDLEQGFRRCFVDGLNQRLTVVCGAGQGPVAQNLHLSAHLSRSLTNPLWVHLRVLHGTHVALS